MLVPGQGAFVKNRISHRISNYTVIPLLSYSKKLLRLKSAKINLDSNYNM